MEIYESRLSNNMSKFEFENVREDNEENGSVLGEKFFRKTEFLKPN